jgi:hypothetical protein
MMGKAHNGGHSQNVRQEQRWPHPSPPYFGKSPTLGLYPTPMGSCIQFSELVCLGSSFK